MFSGGTKAIFFFNLTVMYTLKGIKDTPRGNGREGSKNVLFFTFPDMGEFRMKSSSRPVCSTISREKTFLLPLPSLTYRPPTLKISIHARLKRFVNCTWWFFGVLFVTRLQRLGHGYVELAFHDRTAVRHRRRWRRR